MRKIPDSELPPPDERLLYDEGPARCDRCLAELPAAGPFCEVRLRQDGVLRRFGSRTCLLGWAASMTVST